MTTSLLGDSVYIRNCCGVPLDNIKDGKDNNSNYCYRVHGVGSHSRHFVDINTNSSIQLMV